MQRNEGTADRAIRLAAAVIAAVVALAAGGGTALGVVLLVIAAVLLVTAATGFCPLYRVLGVNTCRRPAAHQR